VGDCDPEKNGRGGGELSATHQKAATAIRYSTSTRHFLYVAVQHNEAKTTLSVLRGASKEWRKQTGGLEAGGNAPQVSAAAAAENRSRRSEADRQVRACLATSLEGGGGGRSRGGFRSVHSNN
jgi:hypothetical protein